MKSDVKSIDELLAEYEKNVIAYHDSIARNGDYREGNRRVAASEKAKQALLRVYGDEARGALAKLLHHEHPGVRVSVANLLLRYKHRESMEVLQELSTRYDLGLICAGAQATIARWEDGVWKTDPEPGKQSSENV